MKKILFYSGAILISVGLVLTVIYLPVIMDTYLKIAEKNDPTIDPEVTYHEFPFYIEYVIDGEIKIIEDTLVCEYVGFERTGWLYRFNVGDEYLRHWDSYLKNHTEDSILLFSDNNIIVDYSLAMASYYMGDTEMPGAETRPSFRVFIKTSNKNELYKHYKSAEDLKEYGIEILNLIIPEPIQNSFQFSD